MDALQLLLCSLMLYFFAGIASLFLYGLDRIAIKISGIASLAGGLVGIVSALTQLHSAIPLVTEFITPFPFATLTIRMDSLSAFMLLVISVLVAVCALYSLAYMREYLGKGAAAIGFFMNMFIASTLINNSRSVAILRNYRRMFLGVNWLLLLLAHSSSCLFSDENCTLLQHIATGKEVIARTIHQLSLRHDKPLVKINCAAIPAALLESELFGHDKGAFTGAINTHRGRFEIADGGTLFLDEIGDLPLELQPKLLRVLQEKEIERLGGNRTIPVNVRVIAATNRDLWQMVEDRQFRSDLFYRLNVFPLELPPQRDRPEDIPLLAKYFTQKMARSMKRKIDAISTDTLRQLMSWEWPGNVRELENVIERAVLLTRGGSLNLHLHPRQTRLLPAMSENSFTQGQMAQMFNPATPENDEEERLRIIQVLRETNGIVAGPRGAATRLGMKRTTLLSRMQRLGIAVREVL